jgi:hypothetical protein
MVGGAVAAARAGGPAPVAITVAITGAYGDQAVRDMAAEGTAEALRRYSRSVLPLEVRRINEDPRRIG